LTNSSIDPEEALIVDRIFTAVMEQRLAPNTKLSEPKLCETFGVGRMRVRRALLLLASQGIVDLQSNKGAYVACPDPKEADEVFQARMMIETGIVRDLAAAPVPENLVALRHHLAREDAARKSGERSELIRLSGEFHVALANAQGNSVLIKTMRELVTRGSLIVGMFGVNRGETCPEDEHSLILDAISSGDGDSAARLIRHHLSHIQAGLDLRQPKGKDDDLASILGG
jgi:DNA-binding GntR family transcriptional regulator